jgi:HAE1 family hydrophobic/amphiphilic exporter-1
VGIAVAASALSLVAVFAPLVFVKGIAGIIFGQLAFVVILTILTSLFVSLTLTPMACSRLLRSGAEKKRYRIFDWSEQILREISASYARLLAWVLDHRRFTLTLIGIALVGTLALVPLVGTEFLPEVDSREVEIVAELPEGTRGEVTVETTEKIIRLFDEVPELEASYGIAGQSKKGLLSALGFTEGTNIGRVGVRLVPKEERDRSAKEIAAAIRPQVVAMPEVERVTVKAVGAIQKVFFGGGRAISIEVLGHDLETTDQAARDIRRIIETTPGAVDVSISRRLPRPEVTVRLDRDKAAALGLNVALVADSLRTNYYGFDDAKLRKAGDDFDIELRLKEEERRSLAEIGETPLTTPKGRTVKLRNVATIEETTGPVEIERKNRTRVTRVQASVQDRVLGDVVRDIRRQLATLDLPAGVSIEWGGEVEEQRKAFRDLTLTQPDELYGSDHAHGNRGEERYRAR